MIAPGFTRRFHLTCLQLNLGVRQPTLARRRLCRFHMMVSRSVAVLSGTLASIACARTTSTAAIPAERRPAILEVSSQDGVSLEVLDWGGSGPPIIFLAGGGSSTPHDFDEFAPRFTNRHRVIGITRRGNGGSSAQRPQSFDDYVDDVVAVLDAFQKNRDAFGRFVQNRVVEFPSASHYFFMKHPDETARVIDAFLSSL